MLERMGISPAELLDVASARPCAPTFAEYVPVVAGVTGQFVDLGAGVGIPDPYRAVVAAADDAVGAVRAG
jgi:hypothetical protein